MWIQCECPNHEGGQCQNKVADGKSTSPTVCPRCLYECLAVGICPCACHHDHTHCAVCTNDYADLCAPPDGMTGYDLLYDT